MKAANIFTLTTSPPALTGRNSPGIALRRYGCRFLNRNIRRGLTVKELDSETGLYYYGARYLDPKTSRWLGCDPALGEYLPSAPVDDEAKKRNQSLPGQGGVFNHVNLHVYHYAGNNPVKYVDPDGRDVNYKKGNVNIYVKYEEDTVPQGEMLAPGKKHEGRIDGVIVYNPETGEIIIFKVKDSEKNHRSILLI